MSAAKNVIAKPEIHNTLSIQFAKNYKITNGQPDFGQKIAQLKDTIKQKIAVLGKIIRQYNTSYKRKNRNRFFDSKEKHFHTNLKLPARWDF